MSPRKTRNAATKQGSRAPELPKPQDESALPGTQVEPKHRMVSVVRSEAGWSVTEADIPESVIRRYLVRTHEPDLKQLAAAHVAGALWEPV